MGPLKKHIIAHHFFRCYQQISPEKMTEAGSRDRELRHVVRIGLLKKILGGPLSDLAPPCPSGHPALLGNMSSGGDDWCPSIHSIFRTHIC